MKNRYLPGLIVSTFYEGDDEAAKAAEAEAKAAEAEAAAKAKA